MAIVINEFEVAVEREPSPSPEGSPDSAPTAAEHPTPEEVVLVLRRDQARRARTDAT